MTKTRVWMLMLLGIILVTGSGCAGTAKEEYVLPPKVVSVEKEPYKFQKVDLEGAYIDLDSIEARNMCTPYLMDLDALLGGVIKFYEWQQDEATKLGVNNDGRTETK